MMRRFSALLLLALVGLGLLGGADPCRAWVAEEEPESRPSSCHEAAGAPEAQKGIPSQDDEHGGCDDFCQHACHMMAVVGVGASVFAVQPQARLATPTFERALPLFAPPIDHIPLV